MYIKIIKDSNPKNKIVGILTQNQLVIIYLTDQSSEYRLFF